MSTNLSTPEPSIARHRAGPAPPDGANGPPAAREPPRTGMDSSSARQGILAVLTLTAIAAHLLLRFGFDLSAEVFGAPAHTLPLIAALVLAGGPLVLALL